MLTPDQIKEKCLRIWQSDGFWREVSSAPEFTPISISLGKPSPREMLAKFPDVSAWSRSLQAASKTAKGYGYVIRFTESAHRQLGQQQIPAFAEFETLEDFLRFAGKAKDFSTYLSLMEVTRETALAPDQITEWIKVHPLKTIDAASVWPRIIAVCNNFMENPSRNLYLRQLDIPGIDTKFIENNKALLRDLLDIILPTGAINHAVSGLAGNGFERRYGLKHDETLIRFRILDKSLSPWPSATDMSLPASEFCALDLPCERVFFTENKINALSFPEHGGAIVVFGGGYGVSAIKNAEWLKKRELWYWGDIDTHGFSILSQFRAYFPAAKSLFMDHATLIAFKPLWGKEEDQKRCVSNLPNLTESEAKLYRALQQNEYGQNVRLEQEQIGFSYVTATLSQLNP